jgi:hypothetical protein
LAIIGPLWESASGGFRGKNMAGHQRSAK